MEIRGHNSLYEHLRDLLIKYFLRAKKIRDYDFGQLWFVAGSTYNKNQVSKSCSIQCSFRICAGILCSLSGLTTAGKNIKLVCVQENSKNASYMYCSLPTFQRFLPFFASTNFTFLPAVVKPLKLQKIPAHVLKEH